MKLAQQLLEEIIDMGGSLGIERKDMPQIDGEDIPEFLKYVLHDCERDYEKISLPVKSLKASQNQLDTEKADKIWNDKGSHEFPIIVSADKYVLDGHHRWLSVLRNDPEGEMKCIMFSDNAKPALEMMHNFSKSKKIDIEDKVVEGKLSHQVMNLVFESAEEGIDTDELNDHLDELGFENIEVTEITTSFEDTTSTITFVDDENNELQAVFFADEDNNQYVTVVTSPEELEQEEIDAIDITGYEKLPLVNGTIDLSCCYDWLTEELLEEILTFGEADSEDIEERSITVIRKGKKVRKQVKRKIRKKRLSAKRKLSIKRGVRKRKVKKVQIQRKRRKSLAIRKRSKLKKKPKNLRVVG